MLLVLGGKRRFFTLSFSPARLLATASSPSKVSNASHRYARATMTQWNPKLQRTGVVGFKLGMMSHYDEWGHRHPVTVIRLEECHALRSFPVGKSTIQEVGSGVKSARNLHPCQKKLYESLQLRPKMAARGFAVSPCGVLPPGTPLYAAHLVPGQLVDVQAKSIGKGFQGAMVRWGFKGMPASHGVSGTHRHLGATGCRTDPGRVLKGKKMAGRMGGKSATQKGLVVLKIDNALNCVFLRGSVPGHRNTAVQLWDSRRNPIFGTIPPPYPTYIPLEGAKLPRIMLAPSEAKDSLHLESLE